VKALYSDLPPVSLAGKQLVGRVLFGFLVLTAMVIGAVTGLFIVYSTDLPQVGELERYRPSAITELYDDQGRVIGTFALQRRVIASYEDFPKVLRDAVTSIEDKDFERHWGIDLQRVLGAAYRDIVSGSRAQGASTLTMQLSRNLFLSPERNFSRKFQEIVLAIQIERRFTKPQIFTMYANQIYLGHGVYGFEAGSQYYFNKHAKDLTVSEAAVLAALPKSPTQYSPLTNPGNALRRRNLVINAMLEDGKITALQAADAKGQRISLTLQNSNHSLAPNFVEEIRRYLERKYGSEEVHQNGLRVYTSLNLDWQNAAMQAALDGLAVYEHRHGWQGNLHNVAVEEGPAAMKQYQHPDWAVPVSPGSYVHALVTEVTPATASGAHPGSHSAATAGAGPGAATVKFGMYTAIIGAQQMGWTHHKSPAEILKPGDIVYLKILSLPDSSAEKGLAEVLLEQDSGAEVALLAIDNASGDIKAMVGGRDFEESKFNRATQALRQVGSSFKPYVYTAAIDTGTISAEDNILDAPVTFMTASGPYTPNNYDKKFWGNIPLRTAFANSRNIPALKIAEAVGIDTVIDYARKFGVTSPLPAVLPLAIGAAEVTLFEQTAAFTTFPNDGVRVTPRYIRKLTDYDGHVREENYAEVKDVVGVKTARIMTSLLQGVVQKGTATAALKLNHPLAGKSGTTNDFTDAWFIGFSPSVTCGVWVGFDEKRTLGAKETGSEAALPIWINFMKTALIGRDGETFARVENTVPELGMKVAKAMTPSPATSPVMAPANNALLQRRKSPNF
jgi:penicillin-binding protein 1A